LWQKAFSEFQGEVRIEPHIILKDSDALFSPHSNETIKIAYAGQPEKSKGWELWRDLVDNFSSNENYTLIHLGRREEVNLEYFENVRVSSKNRTAMVDALSKHKIDVLFHCPIWPETFSYVLYEAELAGCFVLTIKQSGNVADYVKENKNGIVFETIDELIDYLRTPVNLKNDLETFYNSKTRSKSIQLK